ncbi:sulfate/molybdate ABC transporter ATP-binding protein [Microbacterium aureliae]
MSGAALDARVEVVRGAFRLDVAVAAQPGETVAVMGPSGAGKSTLLGVLAGLVRLRAGHVRLGDRVLDSRTRPRVRTAPHRRGIVLLGQEPRLFPHLTAHENVAFGPRARGTARKTAHGEADEWLWKVGLDGLGARRPAQLSGGQQQRVALARALATSPAVILLDEPLTSLDVETAADIRAVLREQLSATRTTAVVATHDAVDAVALASRLLVLEDGRVTGSGSVREVLAAPATRFAAAVAGLNRVEGVVRDGRFAPASGVPIGAVAASGLPDGPAAAVFPPAAVHLSRTDAPTWTAALRLGELPAPGEWLARVTRLEPTPAGVRVRTADPDVAVDLPADRAAALDLVPGAPVTLRVDSGEVRLVARAGAA